jgi:hypothetical protein
VVADLVSTKQSLGQGNKRLAKNKDYRGHDGIPPTVWHDHIERFVAPESCQGIEINMPDVLK